jgi:hypothetical protein
MDVPGFLTKQFYVEGSLRNRPDGFELQARNRLGDGVLVGVGALTVDGRPIPKDAVSAEPDDGSGIVSAAAVSRVSPIRARKGTAVTLRVVGAPLTPGRHTLSVELFEVNLGLLRLSITDSVTGG